jgi:D-serine deaminase-like pyridoxal phosphate-dependent protein
MNNKLAIQKPTLLLSRQRAMANIEKMAQKALHSGVRFRPHFKTHQSAQVGEWFREFGVEAITVSSVEMALYFAQHGWRDITIAFPVNLLD